MRYIIMCGGNYRRWEKPRQLTEIKGEPIVARTIRLLRENGVNDIAISSNNSVFAEFDVPLLSHDNDWTVSKEVKATSGTWLNAFYFTPYPVCYIFGDVVFSPNAIKKIVETPTDDVEFFASAPPFSIDYFKPYAEPFAFKVVDTEHFKFAVRLAKRFEQEKRFKRDPIAWELWQVIKQTPLNQIDYTNYIAINDYTCDIDAPEDISKFNLSII